MTKKSFLKTQLKESIKDISNIQRTIYAVTAIFFLLIIVGFITIKLASPEVIQLITDEIKKWVEEILKETEGLGFWGMFAFIFTNNATVALLSIFLGIVLGIVPVFILISNAVFIGAFLGIVTKEVSIFQTLLLLIPHGIFEIPAILISIATGINFGTFIFDKKPKKALKKKFLESVRIFLLIVLPLLLIAAIIESALIIFSG